MKRLFLIFSLLVGFTGVMAIPSAVSAVDVIDPALCNKPVNEVPTVCKTSGNPLFGPEGIFTKILNILSIVIGIASVFIIIIFGGIRMIVSGGDPSKISSARNTIIFAAMGIAVAASAQILVNFVLRRLE